MRPRPTRRRSVWGALLACALLTALPLRAADLLEKRIDIDLLDGSLEKAYNQLIRRSGIDVLVGADVGPTDAYDRMDLHLQARDISVRQAADWIARARGVRYRIADGRTTLVFTSSYDWLAREPVELATWKLGGLTTREQYPAFLETLRELLKIYELRSGEYTLTIDRQTNTLQASLPSVLQQRLEAILRAMNRQGRDPQGGPPPRAEALVGLARTLETPVVVVYREERLPQITADLALQANINIGFSTLEVADRLETPLSLDLGEVPLATALRELARVCELGGFLPAPPGGIWLKKSFRAASVAGSRELFWEGVEVQGFAARPLAEAMGAGILAQRVRQGLSEDALLDPSVGVAYHLNSGNLIVVAPAEEQRRAELVLATLYAQSAAPPTGP